MKSFITLSIFALSVFTSFGQKIEKVKAEVLKEGLLLFQSEKASWHGGDLFLEKFTDKNKIGGYVSYSDGDNPKCIFIAKDDKNKVIGTVTFEKTFDLGKATTDLTQRQLTNTEKDYMMLREKAFDRISNDTIFKHYKNTNFNIVPIISGKDKRVYVMTATNENGKVIIGNDYLIEFNKNGEVRKSSRLHKGLLEFEYGDKDKQIVGAMHSHLPEYNEIITPTDICTTMLYQDYTKWERHTVLSKEYVSIWDCKTNNLTVITREAWEKISKD